jgi:hypothetical protein
VRILILMALMVAGPALGEAEVFQWSQGFTADCENATERQDGSVLCNGVNCTPSEIQAVRYYIGTTDGDIENPELTFLMDGGCVATAVDTRGLLTDVIYYRYAMTQDTDGRWSSFPSTPGLSFTLVKAKPKAPRVTR